MRYQYFSLDRINMMRDDVMSAVVEHIEPYQKSIKEIHIPESDVDKKIKDDVLTAVVEKIQSKEVSEKSVLKQYKSLRRGMIRRIMNGDWQNVSLTRAIQVASAAGLDVDVVISKKTRR